MSEEGYRAAREARAELARRAGGSAAHADAVTRMVNAEAYRYEHQRPAGPDAPTPRPAVEPGDDTVRRPGD